jgi:hypothetical protein
VNRSPVVRRFYPCPVCLLPLSRDGRPLGPVWPEHYREVVEDELRILELCPQAGQEWTVTA